MKLESLKLESLKLDKFKESALKREQMFMLNGGGMVTSAGFGCGAGTFSSDMDTVYSYDYGYDVDRGGGWITYHNRSNVKKISAADCIGMQNK